MTRLVFVTMRVSCAAAGMGSSSDEFALIKTPGSHVISIFGKDSLELQEIGLKKISDYKRPSRKAKPNAGAKPAA